MEKNNEEAIIKKINEHAIDIFTFELNSCKSDFRRFFFLQNAEKEKRKTRIEDKVNRFGNIILDVRIYKVVRGIICI